MRFSPYLIVGDRIIKDQEKKMDKVRDDEEEDIGDASRDEGSKKKEKESKKKKKKDFIADLKNELWSGVIKLADCDPDNMESFDLKTKLQEFMADPPENNMDEKAPYKFIYDPEEAYKDIMFDSIEDHMPSREELKNYGVLITNWRKKIRKEALAADEKESQGPGEDPEVSTALANKIKKGFHSIKKRTFEQMMKEQPTEVPVGLRRKTKSIPRLDLSKKLDIAYKSIVKRERWADLAKEFHVSQAVISNVVTKAKKKPEIVREALGKQHELESQMIKLTQEINQLNLEKTSLETSQ
jgi:hypothetical protein